MIESENILVSYIFNDVQKHFSARKIVKAAFKKEGNLQLNTDENYLKTIISNLIGNAIKSLSDSGNGKIVLKAFIDPVHGGEKNQKYISITDNGVGAKLENFKALYDDSEVIGIKTGLGLNLIRDLATAINCKITVDSKIGVGTTFMLEL
ncbi:MAG: sensor histidine kinase [Flavobacterium sp.]|nr:sensor histidine kinase [Flavobacterium sp.]